jgi:hypothetical protein
VVAVSLSPADDIALSEIGPAGPPPQAAGQELVGRSPGQLAWARLRRDRTAMISGTVLAVLFIVAVAAPLIERLYGVGPQQQFQDALDSYGMPLGYSGGITGAHWFGLEPGLGRDIFIRMVYGLRTSLFVAVVAAVITTLIGVAAGVLAGYLGGWVDAVIGWVTDFALAMPFLIVALAFVPTMALRFYGQRGPSRRCSGSRSSSSSSPSSAGPAPRAWSAARSSRCASASSWRRPRPAASAWGTCCSASSCRTSGRRSWSRSRWRSRRT